MWMCLGYNNNLEDALSCCFSPAGQRYATQSCIPRPVITVSLLWCLINMDQPHNSLYKGMNRKNWCVKSPLFSQRNINRCTILTFVYSGLEKVFQRNLYRKNLLTSNFVYLDCKNKTTKKNIVLVRKQVIYFHISVTLKITP